MIPAPGSAVPVEANLARHIVRRVWYIGPILIILFWLTRGWAGALAAAIGVAVVAANFLLAGLILSVAARISLPMYHAAALLGFVLRLALVTVTVLVVASLIELDRLAFGVAAVVAYLSMLVLQARRELLSQ